MKTFHRILLLIIIIEILFIVHLLAGCAAPNTVNFAPLISVKDSANGNTVPVSAVP